MVLLRDWSMSLGSMRAFFLAYITIWCHLELWARCLSSGRIGYISSSAFRMVATSQSVVQWVSIGWSRAVFDGVNRIPSSLIVALSMSCCMTESSNPSALIRLRM